MTSKEKLIEFLKSAGIPYIEVLNANNKFHTITAGHLFFCFNIDGTILYY